VCAVGGTYVGNPVAQAAAHAVRDEFEAEGLVARSAQVGETIRARMLGWQERWPAIGDVRGLGSMLALELVTDPDSRTPAPERARAVIDAAFARGLLLITCGVYGNCIRVLVPLVVGDDELEEALAVWEEALAASLD
jgi:4-aminobutyrate aminotransferase/(S)-3-amino-2-methylpropionate transaminase